jgi:hypothetical protein
MGSMRDVRDEERQQLYEPTLARSEADPGLESRLYIDCPPQPPNAGRTVRSIQAQPPATAR